MDIPAALASISTAIEIAKTVSEINKELDTSAYKLQMAELRSALADAKTAVTDIQDNLRERERQIAMLKEAFALKGTLIEQDGFRFFAGDNGDPKGFAVCPRCETVDGRLIQLVRGIRIPPSSTCPQCKTQYDLRGTYAG